MIHYPEFRLDANNQNMYWIGAEIIGKRTVSICLELNANLGQLQVSVRGESLDQYAISLLGIFAFLFAN